MYIKAKIKDEQEIVYINTDKYDRFVVNNDSVEAISYNNLCLTLEKTKELNLQLNGLTLIKSEETTKGFENFK